MNDPGPRDGSVLPGGTVSPDIGGPRSDDGPRSGDGLRIGGFLLLDKPVGVSSFQALHPLKRIFRGLKVGHAGTLDPAASGLLLVGVGGGTRLLEYLEGLPKTYTFLVRFGLDSDTYDMDGKVSGSPATDLAREAVEAALAAFRGAILQAPPAYSAIKIKGERAYDLARAGETVALPPRSVRVHALELLSFEGGVGNLRMTCSKGTYVRSLAHDLGAALGCGAVADAIRRTAIGPFHVEGSVAPEILAAASAGAALPLLPPESAVAHLPAAILAPHRLVALRDGRSTAPGSYVLQSPGGSALDLAELLASCPPPPSSAPAGTPPEAPEVRVLDPEGRFLAIATLSPEGNLCPKKVLARI
jgi:tRNA pseudouridine55 synthase